MTGKITEKDPQGITVANLPGYIEFATDTAKSVGSLAAIHALASTSTRIQHRYVPEIHDFRRNQSSELFVIELGDTALGGNALDIAEDTFRETKRIILNGQNDHNSHDCPLFKPFLNNLLPLILRAKSFKDDLVENANLAVGSSAGYLLQEGLKPKYAPVPFYSITLPKLERVFSNNIAPSAAALQSKNARQAAEYLWRHGQPAFKQLVPGAACYLHAINSIVLPFRNKKLEVKKDKRIQKISLSDYLFRSMTAHTIRVAMEGFGFVELP
jgi:hypothetical protein